MESFNCPHCQASDVVKRGKRYNESCVKQLYRCNKCRSTFVEPDGFERMRHNKEVIARAVHQHIDGMSLFSTQNHLWQHDGVNVTRKTISDWTKKYSTFFGYAIPQCQAKTQRAPAP